MKADQIFPYIQQEFELRIITESLFRIKRCMESLSDEEIGHRPNESSNSIGNLILHLCGNMRQYIIHGIGGVEDTRNRNFEFSTNGPFVKQELINLLDSTTTEANIIVQSLSVSACLDKHHIQVFDINTLQIILHVIEHFSYHTGQIAIFTKLLKNKDLGFYAGVDL